MITHEEILSALSWRYATKVFDPAVRLEDSEVDALLEATRLSASSFGLQPWTFILLDDPARRAPLKEHSWGQSQVVDSSHLVIFCRPISFGVPQIEALIKLSEEERGLPAGSLDGYKKMMLGWLKSRSPQQLVDWMDKQIYLALGTLMMAAALRGVDTCPMEGFDPQKYDELLGLEARGLRSVVLCPLGRRSTGDKYATAKKVRFPAKDVIVRL